MSTCYVFIDDDDDDDDDAFMCLPFLWILKSLTNVLIIRLRHLLKNINTWFDAIYLYFIAWYVVTLVFFLFFFSFTDKQMDDKELSDPMNNVSLIKGNLAVLFLFVYFWRNYWTELKGMTWQCFAHRDSHLTRRILVSDKVERGEKAWVTLKKSVWSCKRSWLAWELFTALCCDGLVLEADLSSVNSLLEDGISLHRGYISWLLCVRHI